MKLLAWLAGLGGVVVGCLALGHGDLAAPPLADPGAWGAWAEGRTTAEAAFALVRVGVLVTAGYLLAVTAIAVAARAAHLVRVAAAVELLLVPAVRRALRGAIGTGLALAPLAALTPTGAAMVQVHQSAEPVDPETEHPSSPPVMRRLAEAEPPSPRAVPPPSEAAAPSPTVATTWTIGPGEHLWGVATSVLADAWGRRPSDREITPYWATLVEENRSDLADPENPDLVFSGQVVRLPPVPYR